MTLPQWHSLITWIPLLPLIGFLINGVAGSRLPRRAAGILASTTIGVSFVLSLISLAVLNSDAMREALAEAATGAVSSPYLKQVYTWIAAGDLSVTVGVYLDPLACVMCLVITGVGLLIHIYSIGYMAHDRSQPRYFAYLNLFCAAMLTLVMADNMVLLFLGWEGVGLCSYLLIGFWFESDAKARAGQKAFIVNRIGDACFILGLAWLFWHTGTLSLIGHVVTDEAGITSFVPGIRDVLADPEAFAVRPFTEGSALGVCLLLFAGAVGKSAQLPLFVWLPDAMAGPTPVSALIHAATMVTAGVFLLARLDGLFALAPVAGELIALIGGVTALFAASIALAQRDIKKVLAYSTISQLGFMFIAAGVGAYDAAIFHLVTHAFFKALLFLGAGAVIHSMQAAYPNKDEAFCQDLHNMGGLTRPMRTTFLAFVAGAAALAGLPPLAGFFSKDMILHAALADGRLLPTIAFGLGILAAILTAAYITRCVVLAFLGAHRGDRDRESEPVLHEAPAVMWVPLVILAVLAILGGFLNGPVDRLQSPAGGLTGFLGFSGGHGDAEADAHGDSGEIDDAALSVPVVDASPTAGVGAVPAAAELTHETGENAEATMAEPPAREERWLGVPRGEVLLMLITAALVALAAGGAYASQKKHAEMLRRQATPLPGPLTPVIRLLENKFYVDEAYERFIVRPTRNLAEAMFILVDRFLIDFTVRLLGLLTKGLAELARRTQSGVINLYAVSFVIGVFVILGLLLLELLF